MLNVIFLKNFLLSSITMSIHKIRFFRNSKKKENWNEIIYNFRSGKILITNYLSILYWQIQVEQENRKNTCSLFKIISDVFHYFVYRIRLEVYYRSRKIIRSVSKGLVGQFFRCKLICVFELFPKILEL